MKLYYGIINGIYEIVLQSDNYYFKINIFNAYVSATLSLLFTQIKTFNVY